LKKKNICFESAFLSSLPLVYFTNMVAALTKNNSKADVAGVVDTINKRVSGK
jgi:hypothetical protein